MKEDNISQLGDYDAPFCEQQYTHGSCYISLFKFKSFDQFKVTVGPKRSTNRNLKEIISIECTKTVIFQLLRPLDILKLAKRELIQ